MIIKELIEFLNITAPFNTAESYDNVGLLTGNELDEIQGVCCCLDITRGIIDEAYSKKANVILSHHPVIFNGLKTIAPWNPVTELIRRDIAAIAIHTNFDVAPNGVNENLVKLLDFKSVGLNKISRFENGYGIVCDISKPFNPRELAEYCKSRLHLKSVMYSRGSEDGNSPNNIKRIAVCCGGGVDNDTMRYARDNHCDAIISGDIKHNFWIEAENCSMTLINAGHYGTEKGAVPLMAEILTEKFPEITVFTSETEKEPFEYCF